VANLEMSQSGHGRTSSCAAQGFRPTRRSHGARLMGLTLRAKPHQSRPMDANSGRSPLPLLIALARPTDPCWGLIDPIA
jgi:hypothetical protein